MIWLVKKAAAQGTFPDGVPGERSPLGSTGRVPGLSPVGQEAVRGTAETSPESPQGPAGTAQSPRGPGEPGLGSYRKARHLASRGLPLPSENISGPLAVQQR